MAELWSDVGIHRNQHRRLHFALLVGESAEEEQQEAEGRVKGTFPFFHLLLFKKMHTSAVGLCVEPLFFGTMYHTYPLDASTAQDDFAWSI